MKKLIGPILVGLVMFGAAFGGAFYLYRHQQAKAAGHMKEVVAGGLAALKEQGRVPVFSGRFVALMPGRPAAADAPAGPMLIVPGTVRYELDLKALRNQDAVWQEEDKTLSVRLPALLLSDPGLDEAGIRRIGEGADSVLDAAARDAARAELLKQARAGEAMNLARDAARSLVERAFARTLREDGVKAAIEVHFAGEDREEGDTAMDKHGPAAPPSMEAVIPAAGNAADHHEGGNESAAHEEE